MKHPRLLRFKPRRRATRDTSNSSAVAFSPCTLRLATCNSSSLATCNSSLEPCALQLEAISYDEHLLERSRTQWQFGDWQSLAKLSRQTLQHHPDRGKLALFTAAGLLQTNEHEQAKEFVRLALDWGVTKKRVCQILVAGVHNSLGKAAMLGGQEERAKQHFEGAIGIGSPGADGRLVVSARINLQKHQINRTLPKDMLKMSQGKFEVNLNLTQAKLSPDQRFEGSINKLLLKQKNELVEQIKKQGDELARVCNVIDSGLKMEVANTLRQLHAAASLENYWQTGALPTISTSADDWHVAPDFALNMITLLHQNEYNVVIEFGSGVSTLIIAKTLGKFDQRNVDTQQTTFVSFDHLEEFYQKTLALLQKNHVDKYVQLHYAPLKEWQASDGKIYPYYSCDEILQKLAKENYDKHLRMLVVVDGPPGKIGPHARYPAVPLILKYFKHSEVNILLDDYNRKDEKEIAQFWKNDLFSNSMHYTEQTIKLAKGALLICINNKE